MTGFGPALAFVLRWEGGLVDDPRDRGGLTRWGVSLRAVLGKALDFNRDGRVDRRDILEMTEAQMRGFYREHYWQAVRCEELPDGVALAVFDCAVNQGPGRAARLLQRAAGVGVDGAIGPITLGAVRAAAPAELLRDFMARRALHYSSLSQIAVYGFGWFRRLFDCHGAAVLVLAEGEERP